MISLSHSFARGSVQRLVQVLFPLGKKLHSHNFQQASHYGINHHGMIEEVSSITRVYVCTTPLQCFATKKPNKHSTRLVNSKCWLCLKVEEVVSSSRVDLLHATNSRAKPRHFFIKKERKYRNFRLLLLWCCHAMLHRKWRDQCINAVKLSPMHKQFQSVYIHWLPTWDVKYLPGIKGISHTLYQPEAKPKWVLLPFANQFDFGKQSFYCRGQTRLHPASPICKHMFSAPRLKYNAPTFLPQKCQPRWC
jgi:hypothetical protein